MTHTIYSNNNKILYESRKDFFKSIRSKEWYRTEGFNEIAFDFCKDITYRKATSKLNRIRWQKDNGTPSRTLANIIEIEGKEIQKEIRKITEKTLKENNFTSEGKTKEMLNNRSEYIDNDQIQNAMNSYNERQNEEREKIELNKIEVFEEPETVVNISIDDVGVKKQKEKNRSKEAANKEKREYTYKTITKVEQGGRKYILNAANTNSMIPLIIALLLNNFLLDNYIRFYVDGARSLQNALLERFAWLKNWGLILDWYHLKKKM